MDDEGAVAAGFQGDALEAGVGLDAPADLGAAGEGDDLETVIADQRLGWAPAMGRTDTEPSGKPASRASSARLRVVSGVLLAGLMTMLLPAAKGGAELVGGQQQRKVERGDTEDGANRKALDAAGAVDAGGDGVEGEDFTRDSQGFLGGAVEGGDGPVDFAVGLAAELAGFVDVLGNQALAVGLDQVGQPVQQLGAAVGGNGAGDVVEGVDGQLDGLLGDLGDGAVDDGGDRVVVRAADFQQVASLDGPAAQDQRALSRARWLRRPSGHPLRAFGVRGVSVTVAARAVTPRSSFESRSEATRTQPQRRVNNRGATTSSLRSPWWLCRGIWCGGP